MSVQVDVAVSSMPDIGNAVAYLRWIGVLRVVGAALVALGVGLELVGEVLGHPSEQTLRAGREAEIAALTARVEGLQRAMQASPAPCRIETTATDVTPVQACPVPSD